MNTTLNELCDALIDLSQKVLSGSTETRNFNEATGGWNVPVINRLTLSYIPKELSNRIKRANIDDIDEGTINIIKTFPSELSRLSTTVLPYIFNGNAAAAIPPYMVTLQSIAMIIEPMLGWEIMKDNKALPVQLSRRLKATQLELDELIPDKNILKEQIQLISEATSASASLPIDLEKLKAAQKTIEDNQLRSSDSMAKMEKYLDEATNGSTMLNLQAEQATKLINQCDEAYRATTTKGLAGAFDRRSGRLNWSIVSWVLCLFIGLGGAIIIGALRYKVIEDSLTASNSTGGMIFIHILLSIASISAPIWLAWLSTKQISQRFKLAEDYSYKATVAKAYEGYRREAARIDPLFEKRLFDSALTRLEEAPLRLIDEDSETHGSPFHELMSSKAVVKLLEGVPGITQKIGELYLKHKLKASDKEVEIANEE